LRILFDKSELLQGVEDRKCFALMDSNLLTDLRQLHFEMGTLLQEEKDSGCLLHGWNHGFIGGLAFPVSVCGPFF
jgi:hypothetical protein